MSITGFFSPIVSAVRHLKDPKPQTIDSRYAAILSVLPDDPVLGYLSDLSDRGKGNEFFFHAQYALAPHVLIEDPHPRFTIANLSDPKQLARICRDHQLVPVMIDPNGVVLLRSIGN